MDPKLITKGNACISLQLKDFDKSRRMVSAYYTAFNNIDADNDIGTKGMTLKSIAENGPTSPKPRIKHFMNHQTYQPAVSLLTDMGEDDFGAFYKGIVGTHALGEDFLKQADSGLITEHSYGLTPLQRDKADPRRMLQVKVWEVSSLNFLGANENTPFISMGKSLTKEEILKYYTHRHAALEKFCRNTDATDELIESLLIECKFLSQHIMDLVSTTTLTAVKASGMPGTPQAADYTQLLKELGEFNNIFKN